MKVLVIGCGAGTQTARKIISQIGHDNIVFVEKSEDAPISGFDQIIESRKIELIPRLIDVQFTPKAKHCKKSHERPYKYHR